MNSVKKIEGINMKSNENETRIALLEQSTININDTLKAIKTEINEARKDIKILDTKLDTKIDSGFYMLNVKIDNGFDKLNNRIWANFYWGVAATATILSLIAHSLEWI
jgi:hypothetical protein